LVFVTKYRRDVLSALAIKDLAAIFAKVCRDFGAELKECNGEDDHVHLLVIYPPKVALSTWSTASRVCPADDCGSIARK
jgi:putative transposase